MESLQDGHRLAGSEFQTDGATEMIEHSPKGDRIDKCQTSPSIIRFCCTCEEGGLLIV